MQRLESSVRLQAFHRLDLAPVGLHAEDEAGSRRKAVEQDGAGAADTVLAAHVRARVAQVVAQDVGQRPAGLDLDLLGATVDGELCEVGFLHRPTPPCASDSLIAARRRSGVMGSRSTSTPRCERASVTALATAAGAPMVPPSPIPFAPVSLNSQGVCRWKISTAGISVEDGTR